MPRAARGAVLDWVVTKGCTGTGSFEEGARECAERSHGVSGKCIPEREKCKCKGPEARTVPGQVSRSCVPGCLFLCLASNSLFYFLLRLPVLRCQLMVTYSLFQESQGWRLCLLFLSVSGPVF